MGLKKPELANLLIPDFSIVFMWQNWMLLFTEYYCEYTISWSDL